MTTDTPLLARRALLRFLATSPAWLAARGVFGQSLGDPYAPQAVADPGEAINVFDFQEVARNKLSPGHYTYLALGTDSGGTLRANRAGFEKLQLRMRRLVDVRNVDTTVDLLGQRYPLPVMLAPCGSQRAFHPDAELATARASKSRGVGQMLSTVSSTSVEDVNAARGEPVWFQLYPSAEWGPTRDVVRRAEDAGCPVLVLTVDIPASNRESLARFRRDSNPDCQSCHAPDAGVIPPVPMVGERTLNTAFMNWDFVDRLRDATSMKLVLKGIVAAEDASLALEHGVDGVIVSNHGGRSEDSGRSTIESLPEVVDAIGGRIPVIVDSGFRRGTDIFKALAVGADAIAIGRPYLWGLGAFGQDGVEAVVDILQRELVMAMQLAGAANLEAINRRHIA